MEGKKKRVCACVKVYVCCKKGAQEVEEKKSVSRHPAWFIFIQHITSQIGKAFQPFACFFLCFTTENAANARASEHTLNTYYASFTFPSFTSATEAKTGARDMGPRDPLPPPPPPPPPPELELELEEPRAADGCADNERLAPAPPEVFLAPLQGEMGRASWEKD